MLDLNDKTSNGNSLTNNGVTEYTSDFPFAPDYEAISCVRSSIQYLVANDSISLSFTNDLTIEAWVKVTTFVDTLFIVAEDNYPTTRSFAFGLSVDGKIVGLIWDGFANQSIITGNNALSLNTWTHIAMTYHFIGDGTSVITTFINGIQDAQITDARGPLGNGGDCWIGGREYGTHDCFDGKMDEVRLWNIARTQTDLNNNKSIKLIGNEPGLMAYWPFESYGFPPTLNYLTNLFSWHKADGITGLLDNDPIALWPDSSGNGNDLIQTNPSASPLYKTLILNGNPVVRLDGIDDSLSVIFTQNLPYTIFVVMRFVTDPAGQVNIWGGNIGSWDAYNLFWSQSLQCFFTATSSQWNGSTRISTAWAYHRYIADSGANKYFYNGSQDMGGGGDVYGNMSSFALGYLATGYSNIDVAELLIYNEAISDVNGATVEAYLYQKYFVANLPPNTPSNLLPVNGAIDVSSNPTLTASAFSDPDIYDTHKSSQWQIATDNGFIDKVWDSGETLINKISVVVNTTNGTFQGSLLGQIQLSPSVNYKFRVRYRDNLDSWSNYSSITNFTTIVSLPSVGGPLEWLASHAISIYHFLRTGDIENYESTPTVTGLKTQILPAGTDIVVFYPDIPAYQLWDIFIFDTTTIKNGDKLIDENANEYIVKGVSFKVNESYMTYQRIAGQKIT